MTFSQEGSSNQSSVINSVGKLNVALPRWVTTVTLLFVINDLTNITRLIFQEAEGNKVVEDERGNTTFKIIFDKDGKRVAQLRLGDDGKTNLDV